MQIYPETKDPSEVKDYLYDWSDRLDTGEMISAQTVTMVDAGGATSPSATFSGAISRVFLASGTHGSRVVYLVNVQTTGGKTLEESFGVDIVDVILGGTAETPVTELERMISEAKAQRHAAALGNAVVDVWRDGRRIRKQVATIEELNAYIRVLEIELAEATRVAEGKPKRRAIGIAWRN